jgi:hypothetical protein
MHESKLTILEKTGSSDVRELVHEVRVLRSALEWYADYGQGAAKEPQPLPSQGVALGMLHYDGGRRAREALAGVAASPTERGRIVERLRARADALLDDHLMTNPRCRRDELLAAIIEIERMEER